MNGILVVILAGFSNGSFPAPSKGITKWKWEHIWLVYSLSAMALLPIGLALLFTYGTIVRQLPGDARLTGRIAASGLSMLSAAACWA